MVTKWPLLAASLNIRDQRWAVPRWRRMKQHRAEDVGRQETEEYLRKAESLRWWPSGPAQVRVGRGL